MSSSMPKDFYPIAEYWLDKAITMSGKIIPEESYEEYEEDSIQVVYDFGEPSCFACGRLSAECITEDTEDEIKRVWQRVNCKGFEMAHIVPKALGGTNSPDNLFFLCEECHRESPDTIYPEMFFSWVYNRRKQPKGMSREYQAAKEIAPSLGIDPDLISMCLPFYDSKSNTHGSMVSPSTRIATLLGRAKEHTQIRNEFLQAAKKYEKFLKDELKERGIE